MRLILSVLFALALVSSTASAQTYLGEYYAYIGPSDHYNSNGTRLSDFGQILQQDRANYHRFGIRDYYDTSDTVFSTLSNRTKISQIWQVDQGSEYVINRVLSGQEQYLHIRIYGNGGVPTRLIVSEGAG